MLRRTPKHRTSLLLAANFSWLVVPAYAVYMKRELDSGAFPPDADTIAIPIFGVAFYALLALPFLNAIWWFLLRRYRSGASLNLRAGATTAPLVRIVSVLGVLLAALLACAAVSEAAAGGLEFALLMPLWIWCVLAFRAAFIASLSPYLRPGHGGRCLTRRCS